MMRKYLGLYLLVCSMAAFAGQPQTLISEAQPASEKSWLGQAQQELAKREYQFSINKMGLQAPNRAQGFRSYIEPDGLRLVSRTPSHTPLAALRLALIERGRSSRTFEAGELTSEGGQARLQWPGVSTDYNNGASGLSMSLSLAQRSSGEGKLALELAVSDAEPQVKKDGVVLRSAASSLELSNIKVSDANGHVLPFSLSTSAKNIRLEVDDSSATFPITVLSVITASANGLLEQDQESALFGSSVAGAGDVNGDGFADVIVGAPSYDHGETNEGAAFVYLGSASGVSNIANVQLESNQENAGFGHSVDGAGDVNGDGYEDVMVGSMNYTNGEVLEGAVFVFFGGAGGVNSSVDALLESNQASARFGSSLAGAGDVNGDGFADIIVGARTYSDGQSDEGAVFIYHGSNVGPYDKADTMIESNWAAAQFGHSVGAAGDVNGDGYADVIVGAPRYNNGLANEGSAYIYFGTANGITTAGAAHLKLGLESSFLGVSVDGAGDVNGDGYTDVIVGASRFQNGQVDEGGAFIYFGGPGTFDDIADAQLESNQTNAYMGFVVAGAGDVNGDGYADVIVGAASYDNGESNEGAAFIYFGGPGSFDSTADVQLESDQEDAQQGFSVGGAGDVNGDGFADVIVGAPTYDNGQLNEGAAFVFLGGGEGVNNAAVTQLESDHFYGLLGSSVAGAGDLNGDGFGDVIVGAPGFDNGESNEGAAFIYFGSSGGVDSTADAQLESNQVEAQFGNDVAAAGDVNGDGFADVIVGAWTYDNGENNEGAAFIYFGGSGSFDNVADALLETNQTNAYFGQSVAGAGDVNGDGYADVIVSAPQYDNGETDEGAAFIYFGGIGSFDAIADAQLESNQQDALWGYGVAGAGDVNGDGYADVIIGAPQYDSSGTNGGAAIIYFGGAGSFDHTADAILDSNQAGALWGYSVSGAGDVNGDGYADVIVGAIQYTNGENDEGAAFLYFGGAGSFDNTADAQFESNQEIAYMGWSVSGAGDVNGDGFADIIIGSLNYTNGELYEGAAFIYFGSAGSFDNTVDTLLEPNQERAQFGRSVAAAGDVNGDGFADIIVGAPQYDNGTTEEGAAFIYYGGGGDGRVALARQFHSDGTSPVQGWGGVKQADGFVVSINATSPRGRELARLQLEACPNGVAFGSVLCEQYSAANWTQLRAEAAGRKISLAATGLAVDRLYHWRARVQYAPLHVNDSSAVEAPNPMSGPWRRLQANGGVADIHALTPPPLIFKDSFE